MPSPPTGKLLPLPPGATFEDAIELVVKASHPVWVDLEQRRRWLQSHAEVRQTPAAKLRAVCAAAATIGFRVE